MSLVIDQLAAYLASQGEGTVGTNIFKHHRPASPVACVSLHATGGYPPDGYTAREHPTIMLFARAATPDGAVRKAYSLYRKLHGQQNLDLDGLCALTIDAINSPGYVGTEPAGGTTGHLSSFNIELDLRQASS